MTESTSGELIERWIRGDAAAGETLAARYLERARAFAQRVAGRELDPDELATEAVSAGLEGLRGGKRPDRFTLWLHGIVRNLVRHRAEDRRKAPSLPEEPADQRGGPPTQLAGREVGRILDEAVPRLPEGSREVIELFRRGRSREEIAAQLGLPVIAVHARFLRAFKLLRRELSCRFTTLVVTGRRGGVGWEAIRKLRPTFREAIVARHLEDQTGEATARRLAIPPETLRARLQTAYDLLRCDEASDFTRAREEWRRARP